VPVALRARACPEFAVGMVLPETAPRDFTTDRQIRLAIRQLAHTFCTDDSLLHGDRLLTAEDASTPGTMTVIGRSHPFQPKLVVDSVSEFLLAAQVSFGRLNGDVTQRIKGTSLTVATGSILARGRED